MKAVLILWVLSLAVCSIYTFILPAWDAFNAKRSKTKPQRTLEAGTQKRSVVQQRSSLATGKRS